MSSAAHATSSASHHGPSLLNTLVFGPYRFMWMIVTLPFRIIWALIVSAWSAACRPIATVKSAVPKILIAWVFLYIMVAVISTARGDMNVLGTVTGPLLYAGHGLWFLVGDVWLTANHFVGVLAYNLGAFTGFHGIVLLAFAIACPHAMIFTGIIALCQTIGWWCDHGGARMIVSSVVGSLMVLATVVYFAPGMSLGSGKSGGGGGGHH